MAIAKKIADDVGYELDFNQELVALGVCNIIGSMFQSYSTTGGFSRTAVNYNAGSKTQLSSIICTCYLHNALSIWYMSYLP